MGTPDGPLDALLTGELKLAPDFEQRSPEWQEWRLNGIGSSEAAVLMGVSKHKSVDRLWREKTRQISIDYETNGYLAKRGVRLEARARRAYEKFTKIQVVDKLCVHPKFPFVRASLDGYSEEFDLILEIKCPKLINHLKAKEHNYIKPEYYTQIQHQLLASGAKNADYWSFDGYSGHKIVVLPDSWFMGELLEREIAFWECVTTNTPPDASMFKAVA